MAREKVKIDASGFIENVRESAVPTYHTAKSAAPEAYESPPTQEKPINSNRRKKIGKSTDIVGDCVAGLNMTEEETAFLRTYAGNNRFGQVNRNGKPIVVREDYRQLIQDIYSMLGIQPNMAAYVDAVLTEHFSKFYPIILSISEKIPSKF